MSVRSTDKTTKGIGISKISQGFSLKFPGTSSTGGGTTYPGWDIFGIDVSSNTSTSLAEVQNVFDTNTGNIFGFTSGGYVPDRSKVWRFTNGYPVGTGDVIRMFGGDGGSFYAGLSLTNGQNTSGYGDLTVTSPARFYQISGGGFSLGGQYGYMTHITVNGIQIIWPPTQI